MTCLTELLRAEKTNLNLTDGLCSEMTNTSMVVRDEFEPTYSVVPALHIDESLARGRGTKAELSLLIQSNG